MFIPFQFRRIQGTEEDYKRGKQFALKGYNHTSLGNYELRNLKFMLGFQKGRKLFEEAQQVEDSLIAGIPKDDL